MGISTVRRWFGRIGRIALVVGTLLVIAAFFTPWLDLSASFDSHPGAFGYSPWFVILSGLPFVTLSIVVAPFLGIIIFTAWVFMTRSRQMQGMLLAIQVFQSSLYLVGLLCVATLFPVGLELGWPYPSVAQDYGLWVAAGGFGGVLAGALLMLEARVAARATPSPQEG